MLALVSTHRPPYHTPLLLSLHDQAGHTCSRFIRDELPKNLFEKLQAAGGADVKSTERAILQVHPPPRVTTCFAVRACLIARLNTRHSSPARGAKTGP